jgi:predicted kinase
MPEVDACDDVAEDDVADVDELLPPAPVAPAIIVVAEPLHPPPATARSPRRIEVSVFISSLHDTRSAERRQRPASARGDAIRTSQDLDVDPEDNQGTVVTRARELARSHLRAGERFVWNATNLSRQLRGVSLKLFLDYDARVRIVYVEAPEGELLARNRARAEPVPDAVIDRLLDRWEVPDPGEAHELTCAVHG